MDHDLAVGKCESLALCTCGKKECAHGRCHSDADGGNVALNEVHSVVNCKPCRNRSSGAIDVKADVSIGIFGFEIQKLCYNKRCCNVIYFVSEEDDSLVEKTGIDIVRPLTAVCLLYDHWYQCHSITSDCLVLFYASGLIMPCELLFTEKMPSKSADSIFPGKLLKIAWHLTKPPP